ncbi:Glycosyltransferase family 9 (heptosyltransferase) [Caballeronia calidae]|uniref:Glycosyltransferase family 9 (Heptosyltransferase) n=1 Tax=Caballeronia calidae TaxID=1777139 RepID=A0A158DUK9_9BURK|nr:glycosyltransferase family 9 protein [Caballeronia calidae]SAK97876.1 Glycosyltransferase family 9 (heptosyltransferase) [Caballeronia calidae]
MKLNLGCGGDYRQGWLNVDKWPDVRPDLVMDLESFPWTLEDNSADEVLLKHVLTNIGQSSATFERFIQELYRVCRPDALIRIEVTHPRHKDFLSDPSQVRGIIPEMFACFDLRTVELWQANGLPGTPLAKRLRVDFERVDLKYQLSPTWERERAEGRIDTAGIAHAIDTYNNVVESIDIVLRARKPFRPGHALRTVDAVCIDRRGGMGDVLMALAAAKALKALSERSVVVLTAPEFRRLAQACPHVDHVVHDTSALHDLYANVRYHEVGPAAYGLSRFHQVDAYLNAFGVSADADIKNLELNTGEQADEKIARLIDSWPALAPGRRRVLLHAAQGNPNRTWPMARWDALASALVEAGHQVVIIGTTGVADKPAAIPQVDGVLSAVDALDALETVALMRRSDALVSADNGPIHLAGASDIAIVGLFSVVTAACRIPYRHGQAMWRAEEVRPSCKFYPCYHQMHDDAVFAPFMTRIQQGVLMVNELFSNWCSDGGSFSCMKEQITVPMVMDALSRLIG